MIPFQGNFQIRAEHHAKSQRADEMIVDHAKLTRINKNAVVFASPPFHFKYG